MFTLQDTQQLHKLMEENSHNHILIQKLLDSHQFTLSQISHEIRNPLTALSGTLQLIEKQHPEVSNYAHWIDAMEDIDFMEKLLEDLSLYNNGRRIQNRRIETSDFLNHIALSFAASFADTLMQFTSKIDQHLSPITGDSSKLRQLFSNLLRNALEATSYKGKIHLHAAQDSQHLIVKISDNGCGISQSHLSDIFNPFITYKEHGTGLGLPIVKSIVEAHKGTISVTSVPFRNTTFTIMLPIENHCQEKSGQHSADMCHIINSGA